MAKGDTRDRKIRVAVIFGGRSGEHEVSLMSARSVMAALDKEKYDILPIGITKEGQWVTGDVLAALEEGHGLTHPVALLPDPASPNLMAVDAAADVTRPSLSVTAELDVIFPVLHGPYGEDGTVQGLMELADLPYVGAGVVGSAVGMDKAIFKQVMAANGIPILPWRLVLSSQWKQRPASILDEIEAGFDYPVFVKPANLGSSVGISKCHNRSELERGLDEASSYDRRMVVEQGADARELEVSVLGNEEPIASVVGEIRPRREFYDYVAKYVSDDSELIIPAALDKSLADRVRALAVDAYRAIDCAGMGRVDMLLDRRDGKIYLNEINTIPGFTRISMYPKLWEATGVSYAELLDRLIRLAIERHEAKSRLRTALEVSGA